MPACTTCTQSSPYSTGYLPSSCVTATSCDVDSACITYRGPDLPCSGVLTNDRLDAILQKIDPLLCAAGGDYSLYNTFCLAPINNVQEFVESISGYVCNTQLELTTFISTTFANFQTNTTNTINSINAPAITCASAGVTVADSLNTILTKYCTKFASLDDAINPSSANWNLCYAVSPIPSTITQGFDVLITQICLLKAQVAALVTNTLPVFNNIGSCLPSPGTADTLVDTVNKIKTRLCQTGTIDTSLITWGCVATPVGITNLQDTLQNIITSVSNTAKILPTVFSGDFVVTNVDNGNLCLGKQVALATPSTQDRLVAATASDLTPGTLQDKIQAGTNITMDYISVPGKAIINASGGGGGNGLTLADNTDSTADYLINKINGGLASFGISLTAVLDISNPVSHEVRLQLVVNPVTLFTGLIQAASSDTGLQTLFCQLVASCPSPCTPPSNVQVTYITGGFTTTSTSTTTTTTL